MADVLRAFLSPGEVDELRRLGEAAGGWTPGRQGTGYDILPIRDLAPPSPGGVPSPSLSGDAPPPPIARALARLGTPYEDRWDAYLIRYRDGAYIPPHVDQAQHDRRHRRLNAMLVQASGGGELRIGGAPVALDVGDAVVFYPDREVHEVATVSGTRLLFSVGAWL